MNSFRISAAVAAVLACAGITASAQTATDAGKPADDKSPATKPAAATPATKPVAAKPAAEKKKQPAKKVETKKPVEVSAEGSTAPKVISSDGKKTTTFYPDAKAMPQLKDKQGNVIPTDKDSYPVGSAQPKK